jgi:hypothetical protein
VTTTAIKNGWNASQYSQRVAAFLMFVQIAIVILRRFGA